MSRCRLTRRTFIQLSAFTGLVKLFGCGVLDQDLLNQAEGGASGNGVVVFRRSGHGRHVSNAAKKHNANHLFVTAQAAAADPAHPGDKSKVVPVTIQQDLYDRLFANGKVSADLRHDL